MSADFFYKMNWASCNNYVAKRYLAADTPGAVYFDDIKMQMISKRYARLYNSLAPPKGVDFLQACTRWPYLTLTFPAPNDGRSPRP